MSKPKSVEKPYVESAWIGTFELSGRDRKILEDFEIPASMITKIESEVAAHRDLIRPHLQACPTADEIRNRLKLLQTKAVELRKMLLGLDTYSKSLLTAANLQAMLIDETNAIDQNALENQLICLEVIAALAVTKTSSNAGAGTRGRGQKPVPDVALVSKIAAILGPIGIKTSKATNSRFVRICQAIANSGGFKLGDPRTAINAHLNQKNGVRK